MKSETLLIAGQPDIVPAPLADERRAARKSVIMPGLIGFPGYRMTIPCKLVDMSATGAGTVIIADKHQRVRTARELPDRILLIMPCDRLEVDCMIRWRDEERFGIKFMSASRRYLPPKPL